MSAAAALRPPVRPRRRGARSAPPRSCRPSQDLLPHPNTLCFRFVQYLTVCFYISAVLVPAVLLAIFYLGAWDPRYINQVS